MKRIVVIMVMLVFALAPQAFAGTVAAGFNGATLFFEDASGNTLSVVAPTLSADGTITFPTSGTLLGTLLGSAGQIYVAGPSGLINAVTPTGDVTPNQAGVFALGSGVIVNADVNASAAIALSKLAGCSDGQFTVASAAGVLTCVTPTGDVGFTNSGLFSITGGSIVNADVNASAAIALSKLAGCTDAQFVVADAAGTLTCVTPTGDVGFTNSGLFSLTGGSIVDADVNASAAIALSKMEVCTDTQLVIAGATGALACVSQSGDVAFTNGGAASLQANTVGDSELNLEYVTVIVSSGAASGTATVTSGARAFAAIPFANVSVSTTDLANGTSVAGTTLTVTLLGNASDTLLYKVPILEP